MTDTNELQAAIERLRTNAYAECDEDLHQCMDDCRTVAMEYIRLGARQPAVVTRDADGKPVSTVTSFVRDAAWIDNIRLWVNARFASELLAEEVPNAD